MKPMLELDDLESLPYNTPRMLQLHFPDLEALCPGTLIVYISSGYSHGVHAMTHVLGVMILWAACPQHLQVHGGPRTNT